VEVPAEPTVGKRWGEMDSDGAGISVVKRYEVIRSPKKRKSTSSFKDEGV